MLGTGVSVKHHSTYRHPRYISSNLSVQLNDILRMPDSADGIGGGMITHQARQWNISDSASRNNLKAGVASLTQSRWYHWQVRTQQEDAELSIWGGVCVSFVLLLIWEARLYCYKLTLHCSHDKLSHIQNVAVFPFHNSGQPGFISILIGISDKLGRLLYSYHANKSFIQLAGGGTADAVLYRTLLNALERIIMNLCTVVS